MTATVCTCIRHERDARQVAVPDPTCTHESAQADLDAHRAARALGRLITLTTALAIALAPAALTPGTWTATTGLLLGAALAARVLYVATTSKENRQ